jgi:hypothetical protein
MLTSSLKRPRLMSMNPTFAELVVYHLPEDEQKRGYTLNSNPNLPSGSKVSVLDLYHYQLLSNCDECDGNMLESAWEEWKNLGKYEHGEKFRRTLYNSTKSLNVHIQLEREIRMGMDGSSREMGIFYLKWQKKGMREAKSDKDWMMWKEVNQMTKYFPEPVGCHRANCQHYGECLGEKIYR